MKKRTKILLVFLAIAALLVGCGNSKASKEEGTVETNEVIESNKETSESNNDKALSFAFLTNTQNNTFQIAMNDTYERLCKENGINYVMFDPDYDINKQLDQMGDAANQGFDAVFVIPVDSAGIRQGLLNFNDQGVPVLNVDTAVIEEDRDLVSTIVGTDAYMAGQIMGEELVKNHPDGAKIAILDFPENESCVQRVEGFMSAIDEAGDKYVIVAQQDGKAALDESLPIAENIVQANPDLDAFFAINDPSALGVTAALAASGQTGKIEVYSIDASPDGKAALLDGEFTAVSAQVPIKIAEKSFMLALDILDGKDVDKIVYLPSFNVTKDQAEKTLNEWQ